MVTVSRAAQKPLLHCIEAQACFEDESDGIEEGSGRATIHKNDEDETVEEH